MLQDFVGKVVLFFNLFIYFFLYLNMFYSRVLFLWTNFLYLTKVSSARFSVTEMHLTKCHDHSDVLHDVSGVTGGGGGQGGRVPSQRLLTGKFLMTYREKRGKEKMEKRGENW